VGPRHVPQQPAVLAIETCQGTILRAHQCATAVATQRHRCNGGFKGRTIECDGPTHSLGIGAPAVQHRATMSTPSRADAVPIGAHGDAAGGVVDLA
jgi:hypothetical protein